MLNWFRSPRSLGCRAVVAASAAVLLVSLAGCGGGGTTPEGVSTLNKRALPADFITRKAVNYSPYREARSSSELAAEVITRDEVMQDLRLIEAAGFGVIRLFSSKTFGDLVLSVIREEGLNLKVQLGAYLGNPSPKDAAGKSVFDAALEAANQAELTATVRLANQYSDIVATVSVGNETMVTWSTLAIAPDTMAKYIRQVRDAVPQPVTTNDNWAFWADAPTSVLSVVDFAAVHTYPLLDSHYSPGLWNWQQANVPNAQRADAMLDAAIVEAQRQFGLARTYLDRSGLAHLPMVIGETGWTAVDTDGGPDLTGRVGRVNQKRYFDRLQTWVAQGRSGNGPQAIFYFQAFDEQWKQGDDGWGLFNKQRQARYVLHGGAACPTAFTSGCEMLPVPGTAVSTATYDLYTDDIGTGLRADAFDGSTAGFAFDHTTDKAEGSRSLRIAPTPANYGWGFVFSSPGYEVDGSAPRTTTNLEQFANGTLSFSVKTNAYPGAIRVGISAYDAEGDGQSASVVLQNGQYGYCNTNAWCQVTIPVSAFVAANPKLDLSLVLNKFVISDVFADNGKAVGTTGLPPILLDGIRWSK